MSNLLSVIVESLSALILLVYIPHKIFVITSSLFRLKQTGGVIQVFKDNAVGLMAGIAAGVIATAILGKSLDQIAIGAIRNGYDYTQEFFGVDPVSICINRVEREYGWNANSFFEELHRRGGIAILFNQSQITEREDVLSMGIVALQTRGMSSRQENYDLALNMYCKAKTGGNPLEAF